MANVKVYVRPKTRQSSVESHRSRALSLVEIVSTPIPSDRVSDDLPSRKNASVLTASITAFRELSSPSSELSSRRTGGGGIASGSPSRQAQVNPSIAGPAAVCSDKSRAIRVPSLQYPFRPPYARVLSCLGEMSFKNTTRMGVSCCWYIQIQLRCDTALTDDAQLVLLTRRGHAIA